MKWSAIARRIGLIRSIAMYYWKPFNRMRLKRFYAEFISPGDLCFDIGAHVGNRTRAWHDLGARVIAVEPQPQCCSYMRRKFRDKSGVVILEKAVGAASGSSTLHLSRVTPTISTLAGEEWRSQIDSDAWYNVQWEEKIKVNVTTLDALIDEFGVPAFCKIDVENHEREVLDGLSRPLPALSFEYYPPVIDNALACVDRLEALGNYKYNWSFGETLWLNAEQWLTAGEMKAILARYSEKKEYGDVYAQLND